MLRLSELVLFLSPFLLFGAWRLAARRGIPPAAVTAAAGALLAMLGGLLWLSADRALPPGSGYVPAQLEDGRIVPGHGSPGVPE